MQASGESWHQFARPTAAYTLHISRIGVFGRKRSYFSEGSRPEKEGALEAEMLGH
jgi:hypothetical protein